MGKFLYLPSFSSGNSRGWLTKGSTFHDGTTSRFYDKSYDPLYYHPYTLLSGYRSPHTNAMLRSHGEGVAKRSLHMSGQAIDVRLDNISPNYIRQAATKLAAGGVGYYPKSGFVHMDSGAFRTW